MENLQQSSLKKSDSSSKETLPTLSIAANNFSSSSVNTLETLPLEEDEQINLVPNISQMTTTFEFLPKVPKKTAEVDIPSVPASNAEAVASSPSSNSLNRTNSILRRSLSLLTRSEEKKAQSQVKVHKYTIYDDEKGEFIEIVEEEWEGDGPPPRKSTSSQRKRALIIDKALPSLPEPPLETEKENPLMKFNQWLKEKYPYVNKYKLQIIVSLIIFFIILIIIILAATGAFRNKISSDSTNGGGNNGGNNGGKTGGSPSDRGKPGLQMNGTGEGTYYDPSVGIGACGELNSADEFIGAMNAQQFGVHSNPNNAPICGMCVNITGPKGNVKVKIMDKCPTCKYGDIDLSLVAFNTIGDEFQGRIPISWEGC